MRNLIAAIYFLLSAFGCDGGGTTTVTRSVADGVDVIHSSTRVKAGIARFECLASASGKCHYAVLSGACDAADTACKDEPIDRFTLRPGETREVVGLPEFSACVGLDAGAAQAECSARQAAPDISG